MPFTYVRKGAHVPKTIISGTYYLLNVPMLLCSRTYVIVIT